jgi:hypothetical protein
MVLSLVPVLVPERTLLRLSILVGLAGDMSLELFSDEEGFFWGLSP